MQISTFLANCILEYRKVDRRVILDRLRVIAVCLVVIAHATRMFTANGVYADVIPANSLLTFLTDSIYSFHMPLFFLLSGYVYSICVRRGGDYDTITPFLRKKSKRLMLPYYIWGILYVAPIMVISSLTQTSYINYVFVGIILGTDSRHLWFLISLFEIFVIVQTIRLCLEKIKIKTSLAALTTVLLITCSLRLMPNVTNYLQINSVCNYLVFFLIGYILNIVTNEKYERKLTWGGYLSILCMIIMIWHCGLFGFILLCLSIVLAIIVPFERIPGYNQFLRNSMGVYILHPMMFYVVFKHYDVTQNPYFFCATAIIAVVMISVLVCTIIRKCRLSIILGE